MHQYFTPFQNVCDFGIVLSQTSQTLTKFVEKYISTSTIPKKCINKIYFMVDLMKLFWCCRCWSIFLETWSTLEKFDLGQKMACVFDWSILECYLTIVLFVSYYNRLISGNK